MMFVELANYLLYTPSVGPGLLFRTCDENQLIEAYPAENKCWELDFCSERIRATSMGTGLLCAMLSMIMML